MLINQSINTAWILSPYDSHVFGPVKKVLNGCSFMSGSNLFELWCSDLGSNPRNHL